MRSTIHIGILSCPGGVSRIPSRGNKIHPELPGTGQGGARGAPVDLINDAHETPAPVSYASYADEMGDRMREAYALVREHLKVAAERNKRTYDLRVCTRQYKVGDWVYYFNPRKLVGRHDKWRLK